MLGMKNHFDISDSIEIREVDIAGVACMLLQIFATFSIKLKAMKCNHLYIIGLTS